MGKIEILIGNIANLPIHVDALVNAANRQLFPGGGVDGALNKQAGPELASAMKSFGGTPVGTAVWTRAYKLNAEYVIHAVGPRYINGHQNESQLLNAAYKSVFQVARKLKVKSVALPLLSTSIYNYPFAEAVKIAAEVIKNYQSEFDITVVIFDERLYDFVAEKMTNK